MAGDHTCVDEVVKGFGVLAVRRESIVSWDELGCKSRLRMWN